MVGVDSSPDAVARARAKAAGRGLDAEFLVADVLDLRRIRRRFETGIDVGLFHTLADGDRRRYAHSLEDVLSPWSTLFLLCFSDEEPPGDGPRRISESDLREAFRSIFALTWIRRANYASRTRPNGARAWLASLTRI